MKSRASVLCDVGYILKKQTSWSELLEDLSQVEEIVKLISWLKLDGPSVVGNFISRRVQPCQKSVHPGYEYQGRVDLTRMRPEELTPAKVKAAIIELFNLADMNYRRLSVIEHAFKLARPPPEVTNRLPV